MEAVTTQTPQDSELQHSFGPQEIGFDYLPLELTPPDGAALRTQPSERLPFFDLASSEPLNLPDLNGNGSPPPAEPTGRPTRKSALNHANGKSPSTDRSPGTLWLEGDVLMCACPDCRAPMSIRLWLMIADCWKCGASIELSEEQEREALRLLEERRREQVPPPPASPEARQPRFREGPVVPPPVPAPPRVPVPAPAARAEVLRSPVAPPAEAAAPSAPRPARRPANHRRRVDSAGNWLKNLLKDTPAWLISMLVHMVVLTLLALISIPAEDEDGPYIMLSSALSRERSDGGDTFKMPPEDAAKFDLPLPSKSDLQDPAQRQVLLAAAQDARDLRLDEPAPHLPDVEQVRKLVGNPHGIRSTMAARDPRLRVEMVTKEGGTTMTEAAVARGLRWLANHQNEDGSWGIHDFQVAGKCNCGGQGNVGGKAAGTALAMLPFLGAGQTHLAGKYKGTVSRGLRWLMKNQKDDGDLRAGANDHSGMYAHGQGTIVLCEAFAMTGDEELRLPAQKAVDFVVQAQYQDGGWRYYPGPRQEAGDTSVVGWQLMALQSARAANLTVPDETLGMAGLFLDGVSQRDGALYGYQRGSQPTPAMTAEGLLCRMYLGWKKSNPALREGVTWLSDNHLPTLREPNIYYWYYGTQSLHHFGGPEWDKWNLYVRDVLVDSQETGGHVAGSWYPRDAHAGAGGRIYQTSLSICCLEVYYRHLPIFKAIDLEAKPATE